MYPIESHCSGSNIALLLLYLYPSSSQLLFVNLLSYLCVYSVLMNKHFSLWLPLVLIKRGIVRAKHGVKTGPVGIGTPGPPVSGQHHHDPRVVCVGVATVPPKFRQIK